MKRLFDIIGSAVFIAIAVSILGFSLIAMFQHEWLYLAEPIICPPGTKLELTNASPVPGELVLEASCLGEEVNKGITAKLIFVVMSVFFVPSFTSAALFMVGRYVVVRSTT